MDLSLFQTTDEDGNPVATVRPETKSHVDLIQCIEHNKGAHDDVINRFIEMYLLGLQWDWFEIYKDWQAKCEATTEWNASRTEDEEGTLPDPRPLPAEPVRPEQMTVSNWRCAEYSVLREAAYGGYQSQFDILYKKGIVDITGWADFVSAVRSQYPDPAA